MPHHDLRELGPATRSIHAGVPEHFDARPVKAPLVMSNNFHVDPDARVDQPSDTYVYSRNASPNVRYLEQRLAALEGGDDCAVTASGVAAISGTLLTLLNTGDHIVAPDVVYTSIDRILHEDLPKRFGIAATLVDTTDLDAVRRAVQPQTRVIHIETPGNPTTRISDIAAIAEIAHAAGALFTVDSTWSGVLGQHPLELGADLVFHSLSKYFHGHGDALGGAVIGRKELIDRIRLFAVTDLGACLSPFNAWQIMRSAETLPLRMPKHSSNAMAVAEFLEAHPKVAWVRYPGLKSHPQYAIACKQMTFFSGMLNFDLKGDPAQRSELLRRLKLFANATCLGHTESLIAVYCWGADVFFRVSIGLEDPEDLIADLDQALAGIA